MDDSTKKFVEDQIEKLAHMVAKGFGQTATKNDITRLEENITRLEESITRVEENVVRLEGKVDDGFTKLQQEHDEFRDRARVLTTRVDRLEVRS